MSLSVFLTWLSTGTNGFLFAASASAFAFMIMVGTFLFNAIRKLDLTRMFYDPGSTEVSSSKFWHIVACFVATIAFLFINITAPGTASLDFIWLTYLAVIAGSASVSSLISAKFSQQQQAMAMPMAMQPMQVEPQYPGQYDQYGQPIYPQAVVRPQYAEPMIQPVVQPASS